MISSKHNTSRVSPDLLIIITPNFFFLYLLSKVKTLDGSRVSKKNILSLFIILKNAFAPKLDPPVPIKNIFSYDLNFFCALNTKSNISLL